MLLPVGDSPVASATVETRVNMGLVAARNIVAAMQGEVPPNLVNR